MFFFNTIVLSQKYINTFLFCQRDEKYNCVIIFSMNFWENVDQEREFKNLTRKELAYKANFSLNSISTGIARNSIPAADVAVRIARVLETTVENLMSQNSEREYQIDFHSSEQESLYTKYRKFIEDFDKLSPENQKAVIQIVSQIAH